MQPFLQSVQIGRVETLGRADAVDTMDKSWTTAFRKLPTNNPVHAEMLGLKGDAQADLENHGGVDKAICAYSADHFPYWREVLGQPEIGFGAFGENFSISGLTESDVCIGDLWQLDGGVLLEVSQPRQPCWKLARRWRIADLADKVVKSGKTGWYFRVRTPGEVSASATLVLIERPFPDWTIERANQVMYEHRNATEPMAALLAVAPLSASWKETLAGRLARLTGRAK